MTPRRTLLTGASGFVGACLARRLLNDGHRVELLVRPGSDGWRLHEIEKDVTVHEADLRDRDAVASAVNVASPDWIFHLAAHGAYSWQADARGIFESNTLGTLALVEACLGRGFESFLHTGSSSEYGPKDHAPAEDEPPEPDSAYAVAKLAATLLCRHLAERHGANIATLRLYSVYGPWEDPRRLMPTLVAHGLRNELPPLVDPHTARDFVYVEDVCDALILVARAASCQIYNVGSGRQTTLETLVEIARRVLGTTARPEWGSHEPRAWDTTVWVSNPAKISHDIGWRAERSLESGFAALAHWLEERGDLWTRYGVR